MFRRFLSDYSRWTKHSPPRKMFSKNTPFLQGLYLTKRHGPHSLNLLEGGSFVSVSRNASHSKRYSTLKAENSGRLPVIFFPVPKSVSQNTRKCPELSPDIFGNLFVLLATITILQQERLFKNTALLLQLLICLAENCNCTCKVN